MMKTLFLFLSFSLCGYGQNIQNEKIKLPADLAGVKLSKPDDKFVSLDIEYIMYNKFVNIKKSNEKTLTSFFENLMWIYKNKKKSELLTQFDAVALKNVRELKNFDVQFEVMSQIRKPFLKSIQFFKNGYLFRWTDESFLDERKIFVIKVKDEFKISTMKVDKDDSYFWNTNLFFKYQRFEKKKPLIVQKFDSITDSQVKELSVSLKNGFSHLNIFKTSDEIVNLVALDNYESPNYPFKDYDSKKGRMTLKFSGKNFKKAGEHKLYLIQSTYPLGKIEPRHFRDSTSFKLIKN